MVEIRRVRNEVRNRSKEPELEPEGDHEKSESRVICISTELGKEDKGSIPSS